MATSKSWLHAFRLRTLPLALSSIIVGGALSFFDDSFKVWVCVLAAVTTTLLQILSNLANDYGDAVVGTDNKDRVGPTRTVQSGAISKKQMSRAIIFFSILSLLSGISLLYIAFNGVINLNLILFLLLGIFAITAAINYTIGKNPYGYKGFGDLFVLIFFGIVGVMGTYFLNTLSFSWDVLLPAFAIGLLSMGVLNLNNMRDIENDRNSGKITIVVRLGYKRAKTYHASIIIIAFILASEFMFRNFEHNLQFLFLLLLPFFIIDLRKILKIENPAELDPFLKKTALKTLLFAILFTIGLVI